MNRSCAQFWIIRGVWLALVFLGHRDLSRVFAQLPGTAERQVTGLNPVCVVSDPRINEASGLACCGFDESMVWMHNDSGDSARLFLVDRQGRTRCVVELVETSAFDWEDMCSFEIDGQWWLLVADVGDNARQRGSTRTPGANPICRMLLFPEPRVRADQSHLRLSAHTVIDFVFDDGVRDCESIAVDTATRQILLISKSLPHECGLYTVPLNLRPGRTEVVAQRQARLGIPFATAMDISPDNQRMVIASPWNAILVERGATESWAAACQRPGRPLTLPPRKQGETICFSRSGSAVLVNSEGTEQPLWEIPLPPGEKNSVHTP